MGRRIIAFDLDGTLVDSVADLAAALNAALAEVALSACNIDDVRSFVGNGARMLVMRALARATSTSTSALDSARVDDVLARFQRHYEQDLVGNTRVFDGLAGALDAIARTASGGGGGGVGAVGAGGDVVLAVATNKPGKFARPVVEALLPNRFALVVGPDDTGVLKPDAGFLRHVEKALGGKVVAFVGDSGVDVETAKNAGTTSVGVLWGLKPDEVRGAADVVVKSPMELAGALAKIVL